MPHAIESLRRLFPSPKRRARSRTSSRRPRFRPAIDALEARNLLATFTVTNLDDSGAGSLRQAIEDANDQPGADLVEFARDLEGTITLSEQLVITDDVWIRGPGADEVTVSGGDTTRVFAIVPEELEGNLLTSPTAAQVAESPTVRIERLSVEDGRATDAPGYPPGGTNPGFAFGGGIYNLGGTLLLDRMHFANNEAANVLSAGGAVANEFGGDLRVSRSHFEGNASSGGLIAVGGAITSDLGALADGGTTGQPNVAIYRSSFVANQATAQAGYIDGVAFSGVAVGGAVLSVTGSMDINLSHFEDNTAHGGSGAAAGSTAGGAAFGGAILSGNASPFGVAPSSLSVSRSTFVGNAAFGGDGTADNIPGGPASGGAISVLNGGDAELTRNDFRGNSASGGTGGLDARGGIANGGAIAGSGGAELALARNTVVGNTADGGAGTGTGAGAAGRGGGLGLESIELAGFFPGPAGAVVQRDLYRGNAAVGGIGGGIYNGGVLGLQSVRLSENVAVGEADTLIDFVPGYLFQGGALGGGVSSIGTLEVERGWFQGNQAIGADEAEGPNALLDPSGTTIPTYPGIAVGGGLHSIQEAAVSRSRFVENEALGGDLNEGSFAGLANGGGIYNDGSLTLSGSTLSGNRAVGGDDNTGDTGAGIAAGGGLSSGSVTALAQGRSASVSVERSVFRGNEARGGDGNQGVVPLPTAHEPAAAVGGGILIYQGTADIRGSLILNNVALGGEGGNGVGGGVHVFGFIGPVEAEITGSLIGYNQALGGSGGQGLGGGIASASLGSLFAGSSPSVSLAVNRSVVLNNLASGGLGGDGLGGGIFNGEESFLDLPYTLIRGNRALEGAGGVGIGGGVYNAGDVDAAHALIFANFASTSDDNCFGC